MTVQEFSFFPMHSQPPDFSTVAVNSALIADDEICKACLGCQAKQQARGFL